MLLTEEITRYAPRATYEARLERVREECRARGYAGILLADQASLFYLFGYDQLGYWVFQVVLLPADGGRPIAICRAPDANLIRDTEMIDDVRVWLDEATDGPGDLVRSALADANIPGGATVGMELRTHCLLPVYYADVIASLQGRATIADASDIVADLRLTKDSFEVAHFRHAASNLSSSFTAARESIVEGARESDVHRAVVSELYRLGGDPPAIPPPIASGPRTKGQTHSAPSSRRIGAGEVVVVEIGSAVARYHAVGAVSYTVGAPSDESARTLTKMQAALEHGFDAFEPGAPIAGVSRRVQARLAELDLSRAGRHVGYGTGIGFPPTWLEASRIKATEHRDLEVGMTFFYFIGVPTSDGGSLYIGEPVLITKDGYERVAPLDYDDWQI